MTQPCTFYGFGSAFILVSDYSAPGANDDFTLMAVVGTFWNAVIHSESGKNEVAGQRMR